MKLLRLIPIHMKHTLLFVLFSLFLLSTAFSQPGTIDPGFSIGSGVGGGFPRVEKVVQQPDGKLLVGGWFSEFNGEPARFIVRLNIDGNRDESFTSPLPDEWGYIVHAIAVQPDGKIIIGGEFNQVGGVSRNRIARLNSDGTLDATFNPLSGFNQSVTALALQPDGKILAGGLFNTYDFVFGGQQISTRGIARLNADGSLDDTFVTGTGFAGGTGIFQRRVHAIAVQPDGKVLVGGHFSEYDGNDRVLMARLNADGSLDQSFNANSVFSMAVDGFYGQVYAMKLMASGQVYIGGNYVGAANGLDRLNSDGSLDESFVISPSISDHRAFALDVQSDGKIVSARINFGPPGQAKILERYNADGTLDSDFPTTTFNNDVTSIIVQQDGNILAGGWFSYNPNGLKRLLGDTHGEVSVDEAASKRNQLSLFPNPCSDNVFLTGLDGGSEIRITDLAGREYAHSRPSSTQVEINTQNIPAGVYLVHILNGASIHTLRLVVGS